MERIVVIGCPGSGKSTFSKALAEKTSLPLHHLDLMFWNEDKTMVEKSAFLARLHAVLSGERWIIDGNYASTMELRIKAADTVIFLDFSCEVCLSGIRERRGKPRSDMPWFETEEDAKFVEFIERYNEEQRPKVMELLSRYGDRNIVIFKERKDAEEFLASV